MVSSKSRDTHGVLSITPGMLLRSQGQDKAKLCSCDGYSKETFHHVQLKCLFSHRRALRQTAHNNITKLFEKALPQVKPDQRFWVWDKSIPTLLTDLYHHEQFGHTLNAVDTPTGVCSGLPRASPWRLISVCFFLFALLCLCLLLLYPFLKFL